MTNVLMNEIEIKGVYEKSPETSSLNIANNLGYSLGESSVKFNEFDPALNRLVANGTLTKVYDFKENGFREALYNFSNDEAQISIVGSNHMNMSLTYCY